MEAARVANATDLQRLAELAREAVEELQPTKGGDVWARTVGRAEPVEDALRSALTDHDHLAVVGTVDDSVVGYGVARYNVLRDGGRLGVIGDLFVEPDFRGVGVGEAMMGLLVDWCEEQGCFGVDSIALPGNRATKNFFEAFGLVARALVVHKSLDGDDPAAALDEALEVSRAAAEVDENEGDAADDAP
jgi:GNAT superfamily N-acetyltransferase